MLADDDEHFWYETIVLGQKLVLTNVLLFANISDGNDKILRLILGLLIALLGLTVQLITQPFKKSSDDNVYCVVQLMLVLFFALGIMVKLCDTGDSCSAIVGVASAYEVSVVMICGSFLVLAIPLGMFARQLVLAQAVPVLRDARTMEPPELLLRKGERYHLFLCAVCIIAALGPAVPCSLTPAAGATFGPPAKTSVQSSSASCSCSCRALLSFWMCAGLRLELRTRRMAHSL